MAGEHDERQVTIGENDPNARIRWVGPVMGLAYLRLAVVVPISLLVLRLGYSALAEVVAADRLRSYLIASAIGGLAVGLFDGFRVQRLIPRKNQSDLPLGAKPSWRHVVLGWRPPISVVVFSALWLWWIVRGGLPVVTFLALFVLVDLVVSSVILMLAATRWEAATGRPLLWVQVGRGKRGIVAALPADELEAILAGDLGDHDLDELRVLFTFLYRGWRFADAASLGDHLYARWGEPIDAYNTACVLVRVGDHDLAVEYLGQALRGGFGRRLMVKDPDLAPLLPRPDVMELYKSTNPAS